VYHYDNNETGKRIKRKREELGLTMEELGKQLGVNRSTIKRYEDGETKYIKLAILEKIASVLGTTTAYLYDGKEEKPSLSLKQTGSSYVTGITPVSHLKKIPIVGIIRAGSPIYANEEILGFTYIDVKDPENYFALRVTGDSMNAARIYEGDVVICRTQDYVENGQIAVVLIDNEDATLKRFYNEGEFIRLEPQSTNPNNHTIIINPKNKQFKILGKVVKVEFNVS